jgi:hypothetical protein
MLNTFPASGPEAGSLAKLQAVYKYVSSSKKLNKKSSEVNEFSMGSRSSNQDDSRSFKSQKHSNQEDDNSDVEYFNNDAISHKPAIFDIEDELKR